MFRRSLKPRHGASATFLPVPATVGRGLEKLRHRNAALVVVVALLALYAVVLPAARVGARALAAPPPRRYPPPHVATLRTLAETLLRYIFPQIAHAPYLRELGVTSLVEESKVRDANFPEIEKTRVRLLNFYDHPDPKVQARKEEEENKLLDLSRAKNAFKNHDKAVFRPKSRQHYPNVVVVLAIDFDRYSVEALTMIVQNRVDYAHRQGYGVYVRWAQEFLPQLGSLLYLKHEHRAKWVRIFCMRAAMFAFPEAEWFWYLDEDLMIMNHRIEVRDYLLLPAALAPIMLREQLVIPPLGTIKTYRNSKAENMRVVLTQLETKLETGLFMVRNDFVGRAILDQWSDPLYLHYQNFPYGPDSALTHVLQWHPFVLSKVCIIPARTIAAQHTDVELPAPTNGKGGDHVHYYDGDFVVHWDCKGAACDALAARYYQQQKNT